MKFFLCIGIIFYLSLNVWGYPLIQAFDEEDKVYQQFSKLQKSHLDISQSIFEYRLKKGETLLTLSSKYDLSISTLVTLNRSMNINHITEGDYILVTPNQGVFISINPNSDLEFLIKDRIFPTLKRNLPILIKAQFAKISDTFYFSSSSVLTQFEFKLWRKAQFRNPVLQGYVSSYYGMRTSPITGKKIKHNGIDIASKSASYIFASLSGKVLKDGYNKVYGYFIILEHENNFRTLYGHLLEITVKIGDSIQAGQHIGYMGNTGMSTGNHVHFEVYDNNKVQNPLDYLDF